jgi:hypothetical protein
MSKTSKILMAFLTDLELKLKLSHFKDFSYNVHLALWLVVQD